MSITDDDLRLRLFWGGRSETDDALAARLRDTFALLGGFPDPLDRHFFEAQSRADVSVDSSSLAMLLEQGYEHDPATGAAYRRGGTGLSFLQDPSARADEGFISLMVSVGSESGSRRRPGNSAIFSFERSASGSAPYPNESALLPHAVELARGLITIWNPDALVLDSAALAALQPRERLTPPRPTIGYVTWIRESLAPGLSSATAATNERFSDGTLLAVDLSSATADDEAETLIVDVLDRDLVGPLPFVQDGEPAV